MLVITYFAYLLNSRPELEEDKPVADRPEITMEELIAKIEALKKINDEEEQKLSEGKRLKMFVFV